MLTNYPDEIEEKTASLWLDKGTISVVNYGTENTYYIDQFENEFFCKNYPQMWTDEFGMHHSIN